MSGLDRDDAEANSCGAAALDVGTHPCSVRVARDKLLAYGEEQRSF